MKHIWVVLVILIIAFYIGGTHIEIKSEEESCSKVTCAELGELIGCGLTCDGITYAWEVTR